VKLASVKRDAFAAADQKIVEEYAGTVAAMAKEGVKFEICLIAMRFAGVEPSALLPEIKPVGNGWISVTSPPSGRRPSRKAPVRRKQMGLPLAGPAQHHHGHLEEGEPEQQDADQEHGGKIEIPIVPDIHVCPSFCRSEKALRRGFSISLAGPRTRVGIRDVLMPSGKSKRDGSVNGENEDVWAEPVFEVFSPHSVAVNPIQMIHAGSCKSTADKNRTQSND